MMKPLENLSEYQIRCMRIGAKKSVQLALESGDNVALKEGTFLVCDCTEWLVNKGYEGSTTSTERMNYE